MPTLGRSGSLLNTAAGSDPRRFMQVPEAIRLVNAAFFAAAKGTPLTAHVTLIWNGTPGWHIDRWSEFETRLWKLASEWLKRRGVEPVRVFVRENVRGRGPHSHWAVHLPADRWAELRPLFQEYLLQAGRFTWAKAVLIWGEPRRRPGGDPLNQIRGLLKYLCKGLHPDAMINSGFGTIPLSQFIGVDLEQQAVVPLQRVGSSECIGPRARQNAGWPERRSFLSLADDLYLPPKGGTLNDARRLT